jgi:hypothetical protein
MDWEKAGEAGTTERPEDGGVPKKDKGGKGKAVLLIIVAIAAIVLFLGCSSSGSFTGSSNDDTRYAEISWPSSGLGALIPEPPSTWGRISYDGESSFDAEVGRVSEDDFSSYIAACKDAGFNVDYSDHSDWFNAKNADGVDLTLSLDDSKDPAVMTIMLLKRNSSGDSSDSAAATTQDSSAAQDTSTTEDAAATDDTADNAADSSLVDPDFKAMMDSYEEFMNKYCDFMTKYEDADSASQAAMLADYTDLMNQYNDWATKMDSVDEGTLSAADDAYYLEVMGRVNQRLAEVAQ